MSDIKVGDELAIKGAFGWSIRTVKKITATGRIALDSDVVLNPDLSIRGPNKWGPFRAQVITSDIREQYLRQTLHATCSQFRKWHELTTDQLRRIVAILDEGK